MGEHCVPGAGLGTPLKHGEAPGGAFSSRPGGEPGPQRVLCSEQHRLGAVEAAVVSHGKSFGGSVWNFSSTNH